jgi:hypothetical protein
VITQAKKYPNAQLEIYGRVEKNSLSYMQFNMQKLNGTIAYTVKSFFALHHLEKNSNCLPRVFR